MTYWNKNTMERLKICDNIFGNCTLDIHSNQKWYAHIEGDKILLRRDIVTIEITIAVFLNDWKVVA